MVLSRLAAVAALSILVVATTAASAQDMRKRGDIACGRDANRYCKKLFGQGDFAVLGCFQKNQSRLSGRCRKFLTDIGQLH